jgi:hypothetical protein
VTAVSLDPIAIGIDYQGGVIVDIVIGAHAGLPVVTSSRARRCGIERIHAFPRWRGERPSALVRRLPVRLRDAARAKKRKRAYIATSRILRHPALVRCREGRRRFARPAHHLAPCLLQERDLTGMIEVMLDEAMEHDLHRVIRADDYLLQAGVGETRHRPAQFRVRSLQHRQRILPGCRWRACGRRPVLCGRQLDVLAFKPAAYPLVPGGDVPHDLPNTMRPRYRSCCRLLVTSASSSRREGPCQA